MTIQRRPLRDDVYREICLRIHKGDLPPGSRVRDAALAQDLGVSRTPVREALLRLVRDGMLESDLGRGFTVRPLSSVEAHELTTILCTLECLALRSTDVFPDARLRQLEELNAELERYKDDAERCMELNDEWHQVLLDGNRNTHLRGLIFTLKDVARRYVFAYMRDVGRVEHALHQHAAVVEALRRGDPVAAEAMLREHWTVASAELIQWIEQSGIDTPFA